MLYQTKAWGEPLIESSRPMQKSSYHIILADIHYPQHDEAAVNAVMSFVRKNRDRISGVTILGDGLDCADLSHHTIGKPRLRKSGGYKSDIDGFKKTILNPLDRMLKRGARKTFICGNHENWIESDLLDAMPELDGVVNIPTLLDLKERGWKWIPQGGFIRVGKIVLLHGDQIGSGVTVARKLVDLTSCTSVMGHVHQFSVASKMGSIKKGDRWAGITLPCLCTLSPGYAKGRPNAFMHGFGIIEQWPNGNGNVYVPLIFDGQFSFAGRIYSGTK